MFVAASSEYVATQNSISVVQANQIVSQKKKIMSRQKTKGREQKIGCDKEKYVVTVFRSRKV